MRELYYGVWTTSDSENDTLTRVSYRDESRVVVRNGVRYGYAAACVPAPERCAARLRSVRAELGATFVTDKTARAFASLMQRNAPSVAENRRAFAVCDAIAAVLS